MASGERARVGASRLVEDEITDKHSPTRSLSSLHTSTARADVAGQFWFPLVVKGQYLSFLPLSLLTAPTTSRFLNNALRDIERELVATPEALYATACACVWACVPGGNPRPRSATCGDV